MLENTLKTNAFFNYSEIALGAVQTSPVTAKDLPRTPPALSQRLRGLPRGPPRVSRGPCRAFREPLSSRRGPQWDLARVPGRSRIRPRTLKEPWGTLESVPGPPKTLPEDLRRASGDAPSIPEALPKCFETQAVGTLIALSPFALVLFCFASCSLFRTRTPFSLCCNQQTSLKARCPTKI